MSHDLEVSSLTQTSALNATRPNVDSTMVLDMYGNELLHFLQQQVRCLQTAADLRQEACLRYRRAAKSAPIEHGRAYLYRIARNLVTDWRRQRRREAQLFVEDAKVAEIPSPAPAPERLLMAREDLQALRVALAELPSTSRHALLWYRLEGVTLREIGKRLGVSESMAGRYVAKALEHCQQKLARGGPGQIVSRK